MEQHVVGINVQKGATSVQKEVLEAAISGDIAKLNSVLSEDPKALKMATLLPLADTPLHVATQAGNTDFVEEIIKRKPGFAWDKNSEGLTPLHIDCALGHEKIVDHLLQLGSTSLCMIQDNEGRTPLHHATINGHVQLIEKLLLSCPKALTVVTINGDTCLHLALINKQDNALKELFKVAKANVELLTTKNKQCHSIYELAKATNQVLPSSTALSVRLRDGMAYYLFIKADSTFDPAMQRVVASLVMTITFQAAINPPPSLWKEGLNIDYKCVTDRHCEPRMYLFFMFFNTLAFLLSAFSILVSRKGPHSAFCMIYSVALMIMSYGFLLHSLASGRMFRIPILGLWGCYGNLVICGMLAKLLATFPTRKTRTD